MYRDIPERIAESGLAFSQFGDGHSADAIQNLCKRLKARIPPSYRWWLQNYKFGMPFHGIPIKSIREDEETDPESDIADHLDAEVKAGIYEEGRLTLVDFEDWCWYFDTRSAAPDGEWPIFLFDHGEGKPEFYANTFADFLRRILAENGPEH